MNQGRTAPPRGLEPLIAVTNTGAIIPAPPEPVPPPAYDPAADLAVLKTALANATAAHVEESKALMAATAAQRRLEAGLLAPG